MRKEGKSINSSSVKSDSSKKDENNLLNQNYELRFNTTLWISHEVAMKYIKYVLQKHHLKWYKMATTLNVIPKNTKEYDRK